MEKAHDWIFFFFFFFGVGGIEESHSSFGSWAIMPFRIARVRGEELRDSSIGSLDLMHLSTPKARWHYRAAEMDPKEPCCKCLCSGECLGGVPGRLVKLHAPQAWNGMTFLGMCSRWRVRQHASRAGKARNSVLEA